MSVGPLLHLASSMHDVTARATDVWCAPNGGWRDATEDIDATTCQACLTAAARYGQEAAARLQALRPKDWNACPYEAHADGCTCGGRAGDQ